MAVNRESWRVRVLQDILRIVYLALIVGAVVAGVVLPARTYPMWRDVLGRALCGFSAQILIIAVLRMIIPRPRTGAHKLDRNVDYARWLASLSFAEIAMHPVLRFPFWFLHVTRVLYLRALGAQLSVGVSFHEQVVVREPSLVSLGSGSQLEPGVIIEAAFHGAGRVRVGQVIVGKGVLIGAHSILMPGATIGHDARVEPGAVIGEDVKVGVGAFIGEGAHLEQGCDLGSYVGVGTGAIVGVGVKMGDRSRVEAGAVVEPGTIIGERERWTGAPARRVE
jgi:UDP-3-O-[3-hydroxymyristoyl] glucosamine N-acyltransferase